MCFLDYSGDTSNLRNRYRPNEFVSTHLLFYLVYSLTIFVFFSGRNSIKILRLLHHHHNITRVDFSFAYLSVNPTPFRQHEDHVSFHRSSLPIINCSRLFCQHDSKIALTSQA